MEILRVKVREVSLTVEKFCSYLLVHAEVFVNGVKSGRDGPLRVETPRLRNNLAGNELAAAFS